MKAMEDEKYVFAEWRISIYGFDNHIFFLYIYLYI